MRRPKDRDFVETAEGLLFCLVGYRHPPDRYLAYLKYAPADAGKWVRGAVAYRRQLPYYHARNAMASLDFLGQHHPRYLWVDPSTELAFSFVPRDAVSRYYRPEARLAEILAGPRDPLEVEVAGLVGLLTRATGLPATAFGITGSVLLGLHNPAFSDIDLLVYGLGATARVRAALPTLRDSGLTPLPPERRAQWRAEIAARFGLTAEDVAHLDARRWNYALWRDRYVSVHPTRADDEVPVEDGTHRYRPLGGATITATVTEAAESVFLPAVYRVARVSFQEGGPHPVGELLSFEGLYGQVADPGDHILAAGRLEAREDGPGRLVVGTGARADGGFIRVLPRP